MINKKPSLKQLKKHFENVSLVKELGYNPVYLLNWDNVYFSQFGNWCSKNKGQYTCYLWSEGNYCEIVK